MSAKRPNESESDNGDESGGTSRRPKMPRLAEYVNILPSSGAYLQVLQNGNSDYGKCVYLFTDTNRYLFNCPENIGRVMRSMPGFKVGRLQNIFLTHNNWWNIGGLPGVGLTLKQSYVKDVNIHGSKNIELLFKSTNCIYDNEPPVKIIEKHYSLGKFEDETFVIDYLPLFGGKKLTMTYELDNPAGDSKDSKASNDKNDKASAESTDEEKREVSVAYICKMKQRPGRMKIAECFKLGVPVGPLLGQLQKGKDVTLPNGKVVFSKDVLEQPEPPVNFAVVDICDEHFLKSLLNSKGFDQYFYQPESIATAENSRQNSRKSHLNLIVHFTDALVYSKPEYQNWMRKFGPHTQHLLVNQLAARLPHIDGVYKFEAQLNHINDKAFPLLRCHQNPIVYNTDLKAQIVPAEPYLIYHMRPHKKFERDPYIQKDMSIEEYIKALYDENENPEFEEALKNYKQSIGELPTTTNGEEQSLATTAEKQVVRTEEYPEVVFLGTSSATQSKFRNVTGILLFTSRHQSILLDCGEGTYHQLYELYTDDDLYQILTTIKMVFISHLHADHHMGLFTLLLKRKEAFDRLNLNFEPVFIVGPMDLFKIQYMYSQYVEDVMSLARRIPSNGENLPTNSKLAEIKRRFNLRSITIVKVIHPKSAFGLIIRTREGTKIVYSGDTLECNRLIEAGKDADLLIHEATLDDTRVRDARAKYHCTISQAVEVARKMKAKFTILTHISTRYNTMPLINSENWDNDRLCIACDFMHYRKSLEPQLAKMLPVLRAAFQRHLEQNLARQDKYECRLKRETEELKRKMQLEMKQQEQVRAQGAASL